MKNQLDINVKTYLINAIDLSNYEASGLTTREQIAFVYDCFKNEYVCEYEIKRTGGNEIKMFASWLAGLPSCLHIAFTNHEILKLAIQWGSIPEDASEKQCDKILDNYFEFLANKFLQLVRGYRIPKNV